MLWLQGNADATNTTVAAYKARFHDFWSDFAAFCAAEGLPAPLLVMSQAAGDADTTVTGEAWNVCQAQLELAAEVPGAILSGPDYPWRMKDGVHPADMDSGMIGELAARAEIEVAAGRKWNILAPAVARTGGTITLTYDLRPGETIIAQAGAYANYGGDPAHHGFEVTGGGSITSVSIAGVSITIQTVGIVTGLQYAMQTGNVSALTAPDGTSKSAHRGTLRASDSWPGRGYWTGETVYRWLPSFRAAV